MIVPIIATTEPGKCLSASNRRTNSRRTIVATTASSGLNNDSDCCVSAVSRVIISAKFIVGHSPVICLAASMSVGVFFIRFFTSSSTEPSIFPNT